MEIQEIEIFGGGVNEIGAVAAVHWLCIVGIA
jgi:hypothetical protein